MSESIRPAVPSATQRAIGRSTLPPLTGRSRHEPGPLDAASPPASFAEVTRRVAERLGTGERAMDRAMERTRMQGLDTHELIALQTQVYRYAHELELASRLVDRAGQAVRVVLQTQS